MIRNIFSWFANLYGWNLYDFLRGADCEGFETMSSRFPLIGIVLFCFVTLVFALYYFLPHARFNKLPSWLIVTGVVGLFCFFWGFGYTIHQQSTIPAFQLYGIENVEAPYDETGEQMESPSCNQLVPRDGAVPQIGANNFVMFGISSMIIGIVLFFILSIVFKRWSDNCKDTPWTSIWPKRNNE